MTDNLSDSIKVARADGAPKIIVGRGDRLGSRLRVLLSAWRFARKAGKPTLALWGPLNKKELEFVGADYSLSAIFDLDAILKCPESSDITFQESQMPRAIQVIEEVPEFSGMFPSRFQVETVAKYPQDIYIRSAKPKYLGESIPSIHAELRKLFNLLTPSAPVSKALTEALNWINEKEFIGVHIRRGDIVKRLVEFLQKASRGPVQKSLEDPHWVRKLELFSDHYLARATSFEAIRVGLDNCPELPIVIFGDSPEVSLEFARGFESRRKVLLSDQCPLDKLSDIQRAYVDLALMARASHVVAALSHFSQSAAIYGGSTFVNITAVGGAEDKLKLLFEVCSQSFELPEPLKVHCSEVFRVRFKKYDVLEKLSANQSRLD